jgi:hypothetical protein
METQDPTKQFITANVIISLFFMILGAVFIIIGFLKGKEVDDILTLSQNSFRFMLVGLGSILVSIVFAVYAVILKIGQLMSTAQN